MKNAIKARFALSLGLLSFAGAGAAAAAVPAEDAQEQARVLLSGQSSYRDHVKPHLETLSSTTTTAIVLGAQEQGREMILGRPAATASATPLAGHRSAARPGERMAAADALDSARAMILGSQSKATAAKTRLASNSG